MANATKRVAMGYTPYGDNGLQYPLDAISQTIYTNAMLGLQANGYATKFDDTVPMKFIGLNKEAQKIVDLTVGANAGDFRIEVTQSRFITGTFNAAISVTDVGRPVYALDDQTLTLSAGNNGNIIGRLAQVIIPIGQTVTTALYGTVECQYAGLAYGDAGAPVLAAADGAITAKSGTVMITKGSAAALTIANPTSGVDDGKRLLIMVSSVFAHVVSNAAGAGFNGGGAATDVCTFAAAKGNNIHLLAYAGVWHVISNVGGTLA